MNSIPPEDVKEWAEALLAEVADIETKINAADNWLEFRLQGLDLCAIVQARVHNALSDWGLADPPPDC